MSARFKPPGVPITAGEPGHNEWGMVAEECARIVAEHDTDAATDSAQQVNRQ